MPSFPINVANVSANTNGVSTIVTNNYATVAQANTHGEQRGAVIRVFSYNVQNQSNATANVSFTDSSNTTLLGPFQIPPSTGNWTERASPPGFLFETTRSNTTFVGTNLQITTNSTGPFQAEVEWCYSFVPGRIANG